MNEGIKQETIHQSPLIKLHHRRGAALVERDGRLEPLSYGDIFGDVLAEYAAVRDGGAGLIDLSSRGRVEVSGAEAVQFLNGLITNDVKALEDNSWMPAAFPNVQGRLLASVRVVRRGDSFLFDTEPATHASVLKNLERFTLAGDFRVRDVTHETACLSVQGKDAAHVVVATLGEAAASIPQRKALGLSWQGADVTVMRATHTAEDGFDVIVGANEAPRLWEALMEAGARPVGFAALEILRVEAGVPHYGVDMNETNVVLEAALDEAVSYTKGCYIGQEIIARIHWRGHVAKRLTGLILDEDEATQVPLGSKIKTPDGKEIGRVTSLTFSPRLKHEVALGYVKYDYLTPGTDVLIITEDGERAARVAEVPMVRGSWLTESNGAEGETA
ncbi:MAG TPA: aminomethyltransferase family protein [Pyrinomonadaceae bacterium]|nr:aminomethyltransferase family protein [Pyrinomonadaceae bacterium]